jgi:type VI secretion system protein VasD
VEAHVQKIVLAGFLLGLMMCLGSCAKVNSGVVGMINLDTDLKLIIAANPSINLDEKREPSPLFIRLYELTSEHAFNKADFYTLLEKDDATLGKDLIIKRELTRVLPGTNREESFLLDPKTRYVGLFAEFYEYKNAKFKVLFQVTPKNVIKNTVRIELLDNNMLISSSKK